MAENTTYKEAYRENHVDFEITNIVWEEDHVERITGERPEPLSEEIEERARLLNREVIIQRREANIEAFDELKTTINFEYTSPAIAVDTSGRFVNHEIVGGSIVRQKIGEDPIEADISGVCREPVARRLDELRNAKYGRIISNRLPGGSLDVQFASTATSPMEQSGAVAISDDQGEFLYDFDMSVVEVVVNRNPTER